MHTDKYQLPKKFIQACLAMPALKQLKGVIDPFEYGTDFLEQPEIYPVYEEGQHNPEKAEAIIKEIAQIMPDMHPYRAAQVALLAGTLVDKGASAKAAFLPSLTLLKKLVHALLPYCGGLNVTQKELEQAQASEKEHSFLLEQQVRFTANQQKWAQISENERLTLTSYQHAIDILVIPLMAMLMREVKNLQILNQEETLLTNLKNMVYDNDALPFFNLHFILQATALYYGKVTIVLPSSQTGFIAHLHGVGNTYHAISLLQDLMAHHAAKLQVGAISPELTKKANQATYARYHWLNATAYHDGEVKGDRTALSGFLPLQEQPQKQAQILLFAQEVKQVSPEVRWSEENTTPIHSMQNANAVFVRTLSLEEVLQLLA